MKWVEEDPRDQTVIRDLRETLLEEIKLQRLDPDPFRKTAPRDEVYLGGAIRLGVMPHHGFMYGIDIISLIRHLLVMGQTGGGKTTVIKNLLLQILQVADAPRIMILERKQEFTELLAKYPEFNVLDVNHLSFNPLLPPEGIKTEVWIGVFTECMINYLDILEASSGFLMDHALRLIDIRKKEGTYPNLNDLLSFIKATKYSPMSKNGQQQQTVINRLTNLLHSLPGMFNTSRHIGISELLNDHCLILLHDVPHIGIQNFLISLLMAQMFLHRKVTAGLQGGLKNLIVIDEASSLFRRQDELKGHPSFISDVVRTARGYGIGLIAASQLSTDLSHSLLANTNTRMMVGGFGRSRDTDEFLRLRSCTPDLRDYVIRHPVIGKAFIADNRWPHIVECNMDNPALSPRLTPDELNQRIQDSFFRMATFAPPVPAEGPKQPVSPKPTPEPETVSLEIRTLNSMYEHHFVKLSERAKQLKVPSSTLKKKIDELQSNGLILIHKVHGRSGAPRDLYELTESGCRMISLPPKKMKGKGSYLHCFYQKCTANWFKSKGYHVDIEGTALGKNIDLIARKQPSGECVAVEIELNSSANPSHVVENLKKAANTDFIDRILCLVPKEPERRVVEKLVTKAGLRKRKPIEIERLWKYMES
ncbi:hypothetical protein PDESU_03623 [Pontiella desulfatans]|uniref:Helicase HerA central domain-containing protein n=2 Tax=Pontiella desulfatans TaxID=2750659 RepID=A0A6C2U583_PONDE|nr:hypothetical protein PDESU_03623 [Pontiella desulfatans]